MFCRLIFLFQLSPSSPRFPVFYASSARLVILRYLFEFFKLDFYALLQDYLSHLL
jgi:hypothetical protein